MQADEQVALGVVGRRGALVGRHGAIVVAGQHRANAHSRFEHGLEPAGDVERHLLLERAAGAVDARVVAAVSWIDHDGLEAALRRHQHGGRRGGAGGAADGLRRLRRRP